MNLNTEERFHHKNILKKGRLYLVSKPQLVMYSVLPCITESTRIIVTTHNYTEKKHIKRIGLNIEERTLEHAGYRPNPANHALDEINTLRIIINSLCNNARHDICLFAVSERAITT